MAEISIMTSIGHRLRWFCTFFAFIFYLGDIGSDLLLSVQFFRSGNIGWAVLTLTFVLLASTCIQIFSYAWFKDDKDQTACQREDDNQSTCSLIGIHVLQIGFCTRYVQLLKRSFKVPSPGQRKEEKLYLSGLAADLSMLRMFETFLESVPQLILQAYIILEHKHRSHLQYISMAFSFITIAWSTVDYRLCLRRSLTHVNKMPCGIPTAVYLSYKVFTISPRILSITLFIMLCPFSIVLMALLWLAGTIWVCKEKTDFCSTPFLEYLYRAIVGVILMFTFFNIRGQNTKIPMTVYYIFSVCENLAAPIVMFWLKPEYEDTDYFLPILCFILLSNSMGLGFLGLYYCLLHPRSDKTESLEDVVDGKMNTTERHDLVVKRTRFDGFLQL